MCRDQIAWLWLMLVVGEGCYLVEEPDQPEIKEFAALHERTIGPLDDAMAFVPHGVAGGDDGLVYVVGQGRGELDLPLTVEMLEPMQSGGDSAVVLAFDAALDFRWGVKLESADGHDVAVDEAGDVVVVGCVRCAAAADAFIVKLDGSSGTLRWAKVFSDGPDASALVAVETDDDGGIVAAGHHGGAIVFDDIALESTGRELPMVVKLAPDGGVDWAKHFVITGSAQQLAEFRDLAITRDGSIALSGGKSRLAVVDFGGGIQLPEGDDFMLALLGTDGSTRWARGQSAATARAVDVAGDRLEVVGSNSGDVPVFDTRFWRYDLDGGVECELLGDVGSSHDNGRTIAAGSDATFMASDVWANQQGAVLTRIDEDCVPKHEASVDSVAAGLAHDLAFDRVAGLLYSSTTQIFDDATQRYRYQGVLRTYDAR